ncbi:MAG: hypothetical protein ACRDY1_12720 [Acidimicrobiales bacterium]
MHESMETTSPDRPRIGKLRALAIGVLATATLAIPAGMSLGVVGHDASSRLGRVSPHSHRIALTVRPASMRLT